MSSSSPFNPQPPGFGPQQPGTFYPEPPPPRRGSSCLLIALLIFGGGALLLGLVCCGGVMVLSKPPQASAAAHEPLKFNDIPPPAFPERKDPIEVAPQVLKYEVPLGESGGFYSVAGQGGKLLVYLPAGKHKPRSLPCILITGAGSNLLSGMLLGDGDSPEQIPYAQAGYAVVAYELDGPSENDGDPQEMRKAYEAFKASRAGRVCFRHV